MKAVQVSEAGGPFEVVERPIPEPGDGQVRVKVEACGICHSDAFVKDGAFPGIEYPRVPGHEVIGRIDALGEGVESFAAGQRVGVGWHGGHCFRCEACRAGDFVNCDNAKIAGISYDGGGPATRGSASGRARSTPWAATRARCCWRCSRC